MASKRGEQDIPGNDEVMKGISDLQRRLRVLEERYTTLRRKGQLIDENFLDTERDLRGKVKRLDEEHTEVRRMLVDLDDKLDRFLEQAKKAAPREDVLVLKKYLEMWDPVQYLTRQEAQRLLDREQQRREERPVANLKKETKSEVSEEQEKMRPQKSNKPSEAPKKDDSKQTSKNEDVDVSEDITKEQVTAFLKKQQDKKKAASKKSQEDNAHNDITEEEVTAFLKQQQDKKKATNKKPKE